MNKIEKLLKEYCPNGVQSKPLEQCCNILDNQRKPVTKNVREKGKYPYYGANGIQDYVSDYIFDGTFLLIGEDGSVITKSGNPVATWAEGKIWVNNHAHIMAEIEGVLLRYLFHFIKTLNIRHLVRGNIPKLTGRDLRNLPIPIPPIPVQEEIVRILDTFSQLQTELQTELELRKKQYEYYRDKLLSTKKDWEEYKLIEVAMYSKTRIFAKELDENNYVGVDNLLQNCSGKTKSNYVPQSGTFTCYEAGDILIGNIRPYLKKIWYANNRGGANGDVLTIRILEDKTNKVFSKYLYYVLSTDDFFSYNTKHSRGGKMPRGDKDKIINYQIPLPPLEEQKRIVGILDKFDALVNDITEGIPAEIALRKKQYEYYRDKLLSFEKIS